jgi:hypothetical protein
MSLIAKLFGTSKDKGKVPSPQEAIQRLREIEEMLNKKNEYLEKKIEEELHTAKKNATKNKRGALYLNKFAFLSIHLCIKIKN